MSNTKYLRVRVVGPEIVFGNLFDDIRFLDKLNNRYKEMGYKQDRE